MPKAPPKAPNSTSHYLIKWFVYRDLKSHQFYKRTQYAYNADARISMYTLTAWIFWVLLFVIEFLLLVATTTIVWRSNLLSGSILVVIHIDWAATNYID